MQLKVVRRDNGSFLFVEASGEFVDLLSRVQHVPIGALAMVAGNQNALANLQHSCSTLPDHLSPICKDHDLYLSYSIGPETVSEAVKGLAISLQKHNMDCEGSDAGPYRCTGNSGDSGHSQSSGYGHYSHRDHSSTYDKAVAFRNVGDSFEISIHIPSGCESVMLGILPDDANLGSRLSTANVHTSHGCFLKPSSSATLYPSENRELISNLFNNNNPVAGKELRMRYHHESQTLEYSYQENNHGWHKVQNLGRYSIPEGTPCCPVLVSSTTNRITVNEIKPFRLYDSKLSFKPTFFVTGDLKVTESGGFSSYVELLQAFQVEDILSLKTSAVTFGTDEMKELICAIFSGEKNVLEVALKEQLLLSDNGEPGTDNDNDNTDTNNDQEAPVVDDGVEPLSRVPTETVQIQYDTAFDPDTDDDY